MAHILVIDDEAAIRRFLRISLGGVLKMLVFCPPIVPASNEGRKPA